MITLKLNKDIISTLVWATLCAHSEQVCTITNATILKFIDDFEMGSYDFEPENIYLIDNNLIISESK